MEKIGGAISFANELNLDFFGCKAVISKDFSKIADNVAESTVLIAISNSFASEVVKKLEEKNIKPIILDKHSMEDAYKTFEDKDSEAFLIQNEDGSFKVKFFSGSLSKSYPVKK